MVETYPKATLWNTEQHLVRSDAAGKTYLVQVALPHGYSRNSDATFEVIYAPDANMSFGVYASLSQALPIMGEGRPVICVGVGYPVDEILDAVDDRQTDLMPEGDEVPKGFEDLTASQRVGGGATAFRSFLVDELRPFIESTYRARDTGRTLFGHSTGGTFALDTLFTVPESFDRYIVGSPVLTYADGVSFRSEESYAATHRDLGAQVFLAAGRLEDEQELLVPMQIAANARELAARLHSRNYPSLELHTLEFPDEAHCAALPAAFLHGFRTLFGPGTPDDRALAFPARAQ